MPHLDEGVLTALLDGEIASHELPPIQAHLHGCSECQALLGELRGLMGEADAMITALGDGAAPIAGPAAALPLARGTRTRTYRLLAWAATVVLAAGAGYWARDLGIAPPTVVSEEPAAFMPPTTAADAVPADRNAASAESVEPERSTAPGSRRIAEAPPVAQGVPAAPGPPVTREVPEVLGRSAARNDLEAAKVVGERLAAESSRDTRSVALQRAAPPQAPAPMAASEVRQEVAVESFAPISFVEAVGKMGGTLRLVDGLIPDRLEASAATVRVIYPLQEGELVLEQRRLGDSISVALRGPVSAESLAVLRRRVR